MTERMPPEKAYATITDGVKLYPGPGIYHIGLTGTDQCYVGRSWGLAERVRSHVWDLALGAHYNKKLQTAWDRHGAERFRATMLQKAQGQEMVAAEQHWIDHHKAATVGFNLQAFAGPLNGLDPNNPGVQRYRYGVEAAIMAVDCARCAKESKNVADLEDCLRWNSYAIEMLSKAPAWTLKDGRGMRRLQPALTYVNARIRAAGDEALKRYIAEPETYPHNADHAEFADAAHRYGNVLAHAAWRDNMRWLTDHAALATGNEQTKLMRRRLQDDDFIPWCRSVILLAQLPDDKGGIIIPATWLTTTEATRIVRATAIKVALERNQPHHHQED